MQSDSQIDRQTNRHTNSYNTSQPFTYDTYFIFEDKYAYVLTHLVFGPNSEHTELLRLIATRGVARSNKVGWAVRIGCMGGCPLTNPGRVWGCNLKLIDTLHDDSIPETTSGKSGADVSTPVQSIGAKGNKHAVINACTQTAQYDPAHRQSHQHRESLP